MTSDYVDNRVIVKLPTCFNLLTMGPFIADAVNAQVKLNAREIYFDFGDLIFIRPEGVVVLSNTIEHFKQARVKIFFLRHNWNTEANRYLDDSGFFGEYLKTKVFPTSSCRSTTIPLKLFQSDAYVPYLYGNLMPWIGNEVNLSSDTLETIKTCLEEIFHNIEYHSGVKTGCTIL